MMAMKRRQAHPARRPAVALAALILAPAALAVRRRRLRGLRRRRRRRRRWRWWWRGFGVLHPDPDPVPDRGARPRPRRAVLIALAIAYLIITRVMPSAAAFLVSPQAAPGREARRRVAERQRRVQAAAAEAAEDDAAFAPTRSRPTPPRCSSRSSPPGTAATAPPAPPRRRPTCSAEWERRLDDLDRRGWRNRVQIDRRADRRVRRPQPQGRHAHRQRHGPDRGQAPRLRRGPLRPPHQACRPPLRDRPPARVLDAPASRRTATGCSCRSSRAPRACTRSTTRSSPPRGRTRPRCATRR